MWRKKKLPKPSQMMHSGFLPEGYMSALKDGSDLLKSGNYALAESHLTKMSFKWPNGNFLFVLFLADAKFLQGKLDEAETLYRDLIEANIVYPHCRHGLALILQRTGREEEAKQHIEIAKAMGSTFDVPDYLPSL